MIEASRRVTSRLTWAGIALVLALVFASRGRSENNAPGIEGVEAVSSKVAPDYIRAKLTDGTYKPEYYSFGKGGNWGGEIKDDTIDKLGFMDIARTIAPSLESQKYFPARDPATTKLVIMVYWGTTAVPPPYDEDPLYQGYFAAVEESRILLSGIPPQVDESNDVLSSGLHELDIENGIRDRLDFKNAGMLGYDASGLVGTDRGKYLSHTALRMEGDDERAEIEENRYFIVLMAYDFQLMWKQKKHKLLWEARFSISERHNQFDKALPAMTEYAARYFGQPTNGLIRKRLLNDHVEVGDPTMIEFIGEPKK
jgi:hypothetical protein